MKMQNICRTKRVVRVVFAGLVMVGAFAIAGCERGDRVAVAETVEASGGEARRSKSAMYSARIEQDSVKVGENVEIALAVEPGSDLKINLDFPWKIEMQETEGVKFAASTFRKDDFVLTEERASLPLVVEVAGAGEYEVEAVADFSVCNDDRCEILRDESLVLKVRGIEGESE